MSTIAFIGAGRMASAMVGGLLSTGLKPSDIACIGGNDDTATVLSKATGIRAAASLAELLSQADTVVLACKPQQLAGLSPELIELTTGKLLVSILAGKRIARISQTFPKARNIVRMMPNTPGQIGAGITGWASLKPLSEGDHTVVRSILGSLGKDVPVSEDQLDAITAVSGSGPAYVFEFAAALREAGVAAGLPRADAYKLAIETILGSAKLMAQSDAEAEELRNQVTSPNGTTYAGLKRMEAGNFRAVMLDTVIAAKLRSEELSREG